MCLVNEARYLVWKCEVKTRLNDIVSYPRKHNNQQSFLQFHCMKIFIFFEESNVGLGDVGLGDVGLGEVGFGDVGLGEVGLGDSGT